MGQILNNQELEIIRQAFEILDKAAQENDRHDYAVATMNEIQIIADKINKQIDLSQKLDYIEKELKNTKTELKETREILKNEPYDISVDLQNKIKEELKNIYRGMRRINAFPITWAFRNSYRYTEKYYNWLLPYVNEIEEYKIPGFSMSWTIQRHRFDGLLGLVDAAIKVFGEA